MPRGHTAKTTERVARANELRAQGATLKEIAMELGVAVSTIDSWLNDPDGSRKKARVDGYRKPCARCGTLCNGSHGHVEDDMFCRDCAPYEYRIWTREAIVLAIQEWAEDHGGVPPRAGDWKSRTDERRWPYVFSVTTYWGSWNAAIQAAGFEPRRNGCYGRPGEDPAEVRRTVELYRSGLSCAQVAAVLGDISASGVRDRLVAAGEPRREPGRRKDAA
jgi:hypothetical protein